jgi:Flp pilus assembly protein TadG
VRLIRRNPPPGSIAVAEKTAGPSAPGNLGRRRSRGQSLVEFSLILTPLALVLLGLLQFGFIFNAYITMTNAVRESARIGTIYIYDRTQSKSQNDTARNNQMRTSLVASFNQLQSTSPNFTSSSTWTQSGLTYTTGDLQVTYVIPTGITDNDPRVGQRVTVRATYHLALLIPFAASFLSLDGGGRLPITTEATMVIN